MKKILTFLLCFSIVFILCACDKKSSNDYDIIGQEHPSQNTDENQPTKNTNEELLSTNTNAPSDDLIQTDLSAALEIENKHAHIIETKIIKSLTNEGTFSISLSIIAETKYVDCEYEVDMNYTKYDQGWILDDAEWNTVSYEIARYPDEASMAEYASNYLPSHKIYNSSYSEFLLPIDDPSLSVNSDNTLFFAWTGTNKLLHAEEKHYFTSQWEYSSEIDDWIIIGNGGSGSLDYQIDHHHKRTSIEPSYDINFNGVWKGKPNIFGLSFIENAPDPTAEIKITNFSWEGFDATINYELVDFSDTIVEGEYISHYEIEGTHFETTTDHFVRVDKPDHNVLSYSAHVWFKSDDGDYLIFEYCEDETKIRYYTADAYNAHLLELSVKQELPVL